MVFWVGEEMETFLRSSIDKLARNAVITELAKSHDLTLHKFREGGPWADHDDHNKHAEDKDHDHEEHAKDGDHGDGDHRKHAEHEDHDHDDKDHDKHAKTESGDHDDHGHAHGELDMHLWLDPNNAKAMVAEIVKALSKADPANAETYEANGRI